MFAGASAFNRPLANWNTNSITDMSETFASTRFNEPLDGWNTAAVTDMKAMFNGATRFNQNINLWNVANVTDMSEMFSVASEYNRPLDAWNVSNVTDMSQMFYRAREFDQPLESWDVGNVTDMSRMFEGFLDMVFNQPLNQWNVGNVTNMSEMFKRCPAFDQELDNWNVGNVTDMSFMFERAAAFNRPIGGWDVGNVTTMEGMFNGDGRAMAFNQPIASWTVDQVTSMSQMFEDCTLFNHPLNNWNVSSVTTMEEMFRNAAQFNQPLENWTTTNLTDISNMFVGAAQFNQPIDSWAVGNVTQMANAFDQATSFDQSLAAWDITSVENMVNMLNRTALSLENYDNTLIGWAAQNVQDDLTLGALNLEYCDSLDERQSLIDSYNWTFNGDTVNCSFVLCTEIISPQRDDDNVPANSDIRWNPAPNASGYRVTLEFERGGARNFANIDGSPANNYDVGNVVGISFTNEFEPGDIVHVQVVPYNDEGPATNCDTITFTTVPSWVNSPDAFKITIDTRILDTNSTPANQLFLELNDGYPDYLTYDFSIDWGDDQYDNNVDTDITHTYLVPGIYTLSIIGDYPAHFYGGINRDNHKLTSVDQWGTQQWGSMRQAFWFCENMVYNATDIPDLSNVTSMARMFRRNYLFNSNINNWDVSNVTDMSNMFYQAEIFDQPLNNWNVGNVTNMENMFNAAQAFNQPLNNWDVGSVTDMSDMFNDSEAFDQTLDNWNVSSVITMEAMFANAIAFNQNLNTWNVSNVETMENMFRSTDSFNGIINDWDVGNVTNMAYMFYTAQAFDQLLDQWNVARVEDMNNMFSGATVFNQPLNAWNVASVIDMSSMFSRATTFDRPLNLWDVSSVTIMRQMFRSASSFNQNISDWPVTNVLNMSSMFESAVAYNQPLAGWDVNSVVNMESMFESAEVFDQPLNMWNVSAVANMSSMFKNAIVFDQPLNAWDVSSVTLMPSMFEGASAFNGLASDWNVASVTSMEAMFKDATVYDRPMGNWDTGEVLTMAEMFNGASSFNRNIVAWNTSFVTTMEAMFENAMAYNRPMDQWNTASVSTMARMFKGATAFNQNINAWNVRGATTMQEMFDGASSFDQSVNDWRVTGVSNMNSMFRNATAYNQAMNQWNLGNVTMRSTFENASALNQYLGDWDVGNITDMRDMLDLTALTRENYDNTLIAWSEQTLSNGVTLGAEGLPYCDAEEERQAIIDTYGWTISDDVRDCPIPECTLLTSPMGGDSDVPVNTNITWEAAQYARGYRLTVGTTMGGNEVVDNETITNETSYEFASDFNTGDTVYVTLIPFNSEGDAVGPCTEESFTISTDPATTPDCTTLAQPTATTTDVPVTTDFSWNPISNADGYRITIGTTTGGNDILDNEDVGNVTDYELATELPEDTDIFVTLIPYNDQGDAIGCNEESFRTEFIPVPPSCTNLTSPADGDTDVPIDTNLSWAAMANATGYLVNVGTTSGGIEVVNNVDVGNLLTYDIPSDLFEARTYYVTIIPYNDEGDAMGCGEESFTTGDSNSPPSCVLLTAPANNDTNVALDSNLSWNGSTSATGYRLTLSTTSGGTDIFTGDIGDVTTYDPTTDFPEGTTIYVTLTAYNGNGDATGCTEERFVTVGPPTCTTLNAPTDTATDVAVDTDISWNAVADADGYRLTATASSSTANNVTDLDITTGTTYNFPNDFELGETVTVTIVPYNSHSAATGCVAESFTIAPPPLPLCTTLTVPGDGAMNVAMDTDIEWIASSNATGYRLTVNASSSTANDLTDFDVTTGTSYSFPSEFEQGETVSVTIVPYNSQGDAIGCRPEVFTIGAAPGCSSLTVPANNATNVSSGTDIEWLPVPDAEGYTLSVSASSSTANNVEDLVISTGTSYVFPEDFEQGETVSVTIVPYNDIRSTEGCVAQNFTIESVPDCTQLIAPTDGDSVTAATEIQWNAITDADGYRLTLRGTNSAINDVTDIEVTETIYSLPNRFDGNEIVTVTVIPFNAVGNAIGCNSESFNIRPLPSCTELTAPLNEHVDVAIDTDLSWSPVADAEGYRLTVGTTPDGTDLVDNEDLASLTSYTFGADLPAATQIYVSIVPYNASGDAIGCDNQSFTTQIALPDCTELSNPTNEETGVDIATTLTWNPNNTADGYRISLGTAPGGTDIASDIDVGQTNSYAPASDLPYDTEIFVSLVPYNQAGQTLDCEPQSFTTIIRENETKFGFSPDGDGINEYWHIDQIEDYPENSVMIYNRWGNLIYQTKGYDNANNVFRGEANHGTGMGAGALPAGSYFFQTDASARP